MAIAKPGGKFSRDGTVGGIRLAEDALGEIIDLVNALDATYVRRDGSGLIVPVAGPLTIQTTFHGLAIQDNSATPLIILSVAPFGGLKIFGDHNGAVAGGYTGPEISFNGQTNPPSLTMGNFAGSNVSPDAGNSFWFLAGPPSNTTILSTGFVGIKKSDYALEPGGLWLCITAGTPTTAVWLQLVGQGAVTNSPHGYNDLLGCSFTDAGVNMTSTVLAAAATVYFARIPIFGPFTMTSLFADITGLGATLTHTFLAAWKSDGTIIGQTADQSATWGTGGTSGAIATAIAGGPVAVAPIANNDFIWVGIYVGTSSGALPSTGAAIGAQTGNTGTTTARTRFGSFAVANTATLPNLTPASLTPVVGANRWFAFK